MTTAIPTRAATTSAAPNAGRSVGEDWEFTDPAGRDVAAVRPNRDEIRQRVEAQASETGEELVGVNLESTPLVVLAVIISVALAAATWRTNHTLILLVTALFAAAFAALDVAEFSHQIGESATTIAALAAIMAVLHAAAALLAEQRRDGAQSSVRRLVDGAPIATATQM